MTLVLTNVKSEVVSLHKNGNLCTKGLILCNLFCRVRKKQYLCSAFAKKALQEKEKDTHY